MAGNGAGGGDPDTVAGVIKMADQIAMQRDACDKRARGAFRRRGRRRALIAAVFPRTAWYLAIPR